MSGIGVVHVFQIRQILLRDTLALIICKSTGGPKMHACFMLIGFCLTYTYGRQNLSVLRHGKEFLNKGIGLSSTLTHGFE